METGNDFQWNDYFIMKIKWTERRTTENRNWREFFGVRYQMERFKKRKVVSRQPNLLLTLNLIP